MSLDSQQQTRRKRRRSTGEVADGMTMTIGDNLREASEDGGERAPSRRKLVSCFVAKVKTVTFLSALHVAAPLVCERAYAAQAELKHRRGWPPSPDRNYIP
jgi:hypothetical protein